MFPRRAFSPRKQNSHRADEHKRCDVCNVVFSKPPKESWEQWEGRRCCSTSCGNQKGLRERIEQHSEKNSAGCLVWKGPRTSGYGTITVRRNGEKKYLRAHRVSYEQFVGPIPDGMIIMHLCDVPACVNPEHLRPGTHADNMADKVAKGRHRNPHRDRNAWTKINEAGVQVIQTSPLSPEILASAFGVTEATVERIKREGRRAQRVQA